MLDVAICIELSLATKSTATEASELVNVAAVSVVPEFTAITPVTVTPVLVVANFSLPLWYSSTSAFALAMIAFSVAFALINISDPLINRLPVPTSSI